MIVCPLTDTRSRIRTDGERHILLSHSITWDCRILSWASTCLSEFEQFVSRDSACELCSRTCTTPFDSCEMHQPSLSRHHHAGTRNRHQCCHVLRRRPGASAQHAVPSCGECRADGRPHRKRRLRPDFTSRHSGLASSQPLLRADRLLYRAGAHPRRHLKPQTHPTDRLQLL